ncbi:uncharacterized protein LOC119599897 [Lucilia sericata]|uniref:uncharacterized protein LOC119599897 n=1 Tax=Lucilia sericata TaxID=13632 RepID=UPI0018A7F92F|nr:uncharacterized protein LOC119599897 [Lucilia sericata]
MKLINIIFQIFPIIVIACANKSFKHCFDVLDNYNENQIKNIYNFTLEKVANTSPANKIFECYLKETRQKEVKTIDENYFDILLKCNEYKKQQLSNLELHHIEELKKMGLPLYLEQHVRSRINAGGGMGHEQVREILKYIENDLTEKIELSDQYTQYRSFVHAKLTSFGKSGKKSTATHASIVFTVLIAFLIKQF